MTNNRLPTRLRDYANVSTIDRLAVSRAQHFQSREKCPEPVCDDTVDAISDWSDSDRECDPLSDFESMTGGYDNDPKTKYYNTPFDQENQSPQNTSRLSRAVETPFPNIDDSTTSTQVSFVMEIEKSKPHYIKNQPSGSMPTRIPTQQPLLPARRVQTKEVTVHRPLNRAMTNAHVSYAPSISRTGVQNQARFGIARENTVNSNFNYRLGTESALSTYSSFQPHEDPSHQRQTTSPSFSQASIPRAYEIKKIFVGECDYGRLTDSSAQRLPPPRNRQKWGTIVHPPFPLGYQHVASEQITQAVERLASPVRCRDRHTSVQTSYKRYLTVEETDALITRLTRVKSVRSSDQCWSAQRQTKSLKTAHNNWKEGGIPT